MITALGGGVGAAKFLKGLSHVVNPGNLTAVINTADDIDIYGFRVSPDIDTVVYRLAGLIDRKKGWGLENDTYNTLSILKQLGYETWFRLGDKDFGIQVFKALLTKKGMTVSEVTRELLKKLNISGTSILPMSDERVETWIETDDAPIHFQEYYIKYGMTPAVSGVEFVGSSAARPAPGVVESIMNSELVFISPSNPIISIGPILNINGIRNALVETEARVVAVSPLIGGRPLKGPADKLMKGLGMEVSSKQIANIYIDFLDVMVIDKQDSFEERGIREMGLDILVADTIMANDRKSRDMSKIILGYLNYL